MFLPWTLILSFPHGRRKLLGGSSAPASEPEVEEDTRGFLPFQAQRIDDLGFLQEFQKSDDSTLGRAHRVEALV
jgi:hypothetical protein